MSTSSRARHRRLLTAKNRQRMVQMRVVRWLRAVQRNPIHPDRVGTQSGAELMVGICAMRAAHQVKMAALRQQIASRNTPPAMEPVLPGSIAWILQNTAKKES